MSKNPALEYLYCESNELTSLDVSKKPLLEYLDCSDNALPNLDVSQNPALEYLYCSSNQLTSLNVSQNPALIDLRCSDNALPNLDVSKNPALEYLVCEANQLTSLDVSCNNRLDYIKCSDNAVTVMIDQSRKLALSKLDGFDVTRASDWVGGTVENGVLTVDDGADKVTYTYNIGQGYTKQFTLKIKLDTSEPTPTPTPTIAPTATPAPTSTPIAPCDIGNADVAAIPEQTYTGKALTPKPGYVKVNGRTLKEGTDYTLSYENNVEPGTAKIVITGIGNYTGKRTVTFTINGLVKEIKLSTDKLVIKKGKTGTLKAEVLPATAADKSLTWKSSNAKVATVDANGVVKALKKGTVTITATANDGSGVSASATVVVMNTLPKSVSIDKKKASLEVGDTLKLKATVKPTDADDRSVTWTSSNPAVAKVSKKGKVTAVSVGTAKITATTANGKTAVCKITVKPTKVTKITIKGKDTMRVGKTQMLKAKIAPSNATDKTVKWKSSNPAVATVDENGLVTAIKKGKVTITATAKDGSKVKAVFKIQVKK